MIQRVGNDRVLRPQKRFKQSTIRIKAGSKQNRIIVTKERGQAVLKRPVNVLRATDKPNRRHPKTIGVHRGFCCRNKVRIISKSQIIIGAQIDDFPRTNSDMPRLRRRNFAFSFMQPVGLNLGKCLFNMM